MEIKVLGSGCSRCHNTLQTVEKVVKDHGLAADVEYVTDMGRIMEYNIMSFPAVVVDGKVAIKGKVPSERDVERALGIGA